jgi:hypothetical protein
MKEKEKEWTSWKRRQRYETRAMTSPVQGIVWFPQKKLQDMEAKGICGSKSKLKAPSGVVR